MTYLEWNDQIAKHFFNPEKAGLRVWLSVEQELIDKIAQQNNVDPDDFIKAIKEGPEWINRPNQTICSKAKAVYDEWRCNKSKFEYPPYIAYLALFVLAVNHEDNDNFSESNYYGRLGRIVGEELSTNHFQRTSGLWDGLEIWSLKNKESAWGEFHNDTIGKKFYVGIPAYQVILTTADKNNLPEIFWKMGWDSDSNPTQEEILKALKNNKSFLSSRTSKRIEKGKSDFLSILGDRVLEELRDYDEDENLKEAEDQESAKRGSIEICLSIDETAQTVEFSFRCKRKAGLPEENFILKNNDSKWEAVPFTSVLSQKIEEFNINDWKKDFSTQSGKYTFYYKGEKYKIFSPADKQGVSGWISNHRPAKDKLFYLTIHKDLSQKVQKWGETSCDKCQDLDFAGIPKNWQLFKIKGINGDSGIRQDIPALAIDKRLRISFEGGIRPARGNKFFNFAPPKIAITGELESTSKLVYSIDNQETKPLLAPQEEPNIFHLPKNIPCGENIEIKIVEGALQNQFQSQESENVISKKNLRLVENRLKKISDYLNSQAMDRFGNFKQIQHSQSNDESAFSQEPYNKPDESFSSKKLYFTGAYCYDFKSKNIYPKLPRVSLAGVKTIYLAGHVPGQIVVWPIESWPESWPPVWMIQFKTYKKAIAYLIGDIEETANTGQNFSQEKIKLWEKIMWSNRKRIKSKPQGLWKAWAKKRAKHV